MASGDETGGGGESAAAASGSNSSDPHPASNIVSRTDVILYAATCLRSAVGLFIRILSDSVKIPPDVKPIRQRKVTVGIQKKQGTENDTGSSVTPLS